MTKAKQQFSDRVRFNWGYHDAAFDAERDKRKRVVQQGPQSEQVVSHAFDAAYAEGYAAGLCDVDAGAYTGDSTQAWDRS